MIRRGRLTDDVPEDGEAFHELLGRPGARIVHIVSSDQPDTGAYDQDDDEWVLVVCGGATLEVEGEAVELTAGDHVLLPARTRHRVLRTERGTQWLAVHLTAGDDAET